MGGSGSDSGATHRTVPYSPGARIGAARPIPSRPAVSAPVLPQRTMHTLHLAWSLVAFVLGAALGSFVGLVVVRVPANRSIVSPRSACDVCATPLHGVDLVPIVGWIALRARCRHCGAPVSAAWPLIELCTALVVFLLFQRIVPGAAQLGLVPLLAFVLFAGFATLLLAAAFTDVRARIIPEFASVHAIPAAIAAHALLEALGWQDPLAIGWRASVLGALLGGGVLAAMAWSWRAVTGSEGMAWGDVRLLGLIGALVGPVPGTWVVLLVASFLGAGAGIVAAVARGRSAGLPFGPWLVIAALGWWLHGPAFTRAWLPGLALWLP